MQLDDDFDAQMRLATDLSLMEYNSKQMDHKYSCSEGAQGNNNNNNNGIMAFSLASCNYSDSMWHL